MKDIVQLIKQKEDNEKKIAELSEENKRLTEQISSGYMMHLKEIFSEYEEWYFCVSRHSDNCYDFIHCGKFKYFSFLGEKDKKRLPKCSNDYEAHFEFIDGFTTDLKDIANNNLSIDITKDDVYYEIDSTIQDSTIRFRYNWWITKELFYKSKQDILKKIRNYSAASYDEYKCGDKIEYANRNGIFIGDIIMIRGKSAFLTDGTKVNLSTPRVKKI